MFRLGQQNVNVLHLREGKQRTFEGTLRTFEGKQGTVTKHNATLRLFGLPKYITLYNSASESFIIMCDT